jgi:hypothetical protein
VFRSQDTIARVGGDEFAVLLVGADPQATQRLVTRVHEQLHAAGISVSTGTAETAAGSLDAELTDLLDQADRGMYAAKAEQERSSAAHHTGENPPLSPAVLPGVASWFADRWTTARPHIPTGCASTADSCDRRLGPIRHGLLPAGIIDDGDHPAECRVGVLPGVNASQVKNR